MVDATSFLNTGLAANPQRQEAPLKEMGKDTFMNLLITQMTYQDPLEPMDNSEFLSQMAQFSSLEQMQNIATGMELLTLSQTASTNSQMVNLIGKRVMVPGSQVSLDGTKGAEIRYHLEGETMPSTMTIKNSDGDVVRTMDITSFKPGVNKIDFDGMDADGNLLEEGTYTFSIADSAGKGIEGLSTYANYIVESVAFEGTAIWLKSGDATIDLGDVSEVIQK